MHHRRSPQAQHRLGGGTAAEPSQKSKSCLCLSFRMGFCSDVGAPSAVLQAATAPVAPVTSLSDGTCEPSEYEGQLLCG